MNITIIGGGLCGIFAAITLRDYGYEPVIIEKSRSIGGRMATRRIGQDRVDHGAQFFTVRSPELQALTLKWLESGWIWRWFGDDYPRYAGINGMNPFVKQLAEGLPIHLNERIVKIKPSSSPSLSLITENNHSYKTDLTVITSPVPQALSLLQQSPQLLTAKTEQKLSKSYFKPAFVGLIILKQSINVGNDGITSEGLSLGIDKIVANDQKGISTTPILSVYMSGDWSSDRFLQDDKSVIEELLATVTHRMIPSELIADVQLKRWRYAEATHVYHEPFLKLDNHSIYVAGDSFLTRDDESGRTRVESAMLSGIRVGEAIHQKLST